MPNQKGRSFLHLGRKRRRCRTLPIINNHDFKEEKKMKKVIATALAATMLMANSISASAATTGKWDFGAIQGSVNIAIQDIVKNQECRITYDFNGGSIWDFSAGFKAQTEHTCTAKGTHIVEDLNPTRFMYKLKGWECDGVLYEAGDEIVLTGDVTLTAVWVRK